MASKRAEPRIDPRHAEVYMLADQGRSSRQIAQQLQRPEGEVELILALRGKHAEPAACPKPLEYLKSSYNISWHQVCDPSAHGDCIITRTKAV